MKKYLLILLGVVAIAFATRVSFAPKNQSISLRSTAGGTSVSSHIISADIYPPKWATGVLDYDTAGDIGQTICNKNWSTSSIRPSVSYTNKLKLQQLRLLGYTDQNPADYEEDHLVSLEIGGSPTSTSNLWPEPYNASIPDGGARTKDKVEGYLHKQICAGKMTPEEAMKEITTDWYKIYVENIK